MPEKKYPLERGGPERLKVCWSGLWKEFKVELDGRPIGAIDGGTSALKAGHDFALGDGTTLSVKLATGLVTELQLLRGGVPIPGSQSDPAERLKAAYCMVYAVAALNAAAGLIVLLFQVEVLIEMGIGVGSLAAAAVYAGLAFWVQKGRSALALGIAIALFALDGIVSTISRGSATGIVVRFFLVVPMFRGFAAISALGDRPA